ncbi:putative structural maintenance of chromosomes protein [Gregarina niphandrodes]|uniref:Structural maintenance of chromosomes protein n=1 Tax=Gregarina niphandrodes TaxID=110365 RepID=A0A023BBD6_GRENI|nr:putative structural maintenance of chromosomes protein [Gregarina niphandrodes]EZG79520.1 putative structural maintenance of chromosomes protein [Gregarina niphandrodes]|eukprot:XP_011134417.1 putative structural maintenance of chromosomes protein [Gregarina niphandrodes]
MCSWRLDTVVITDFKSFGGRHVLGPFQSFNCVVGLNGSGKSNFLDALSFALGMNNKHLRSNRFNDLCHQDRRAQVQVRFRQVTGDASERATPTTEEYSETGVGPREGQGAAGEGQTDGISSSRVLTLERRVVSDSCTILLVNGSTTDRKTYNKRLSEIGVFGKNCLVAQGHVEAISLSTSKERGRTIDQLSGSSAFKEEYEEVAKQSQTLAADLKVAQSRKADAENELRSCRKQLEDLKQFNAVKALSTATKKLSKLVDCCHIEDQLHVRLTENKALLEEIGHLKKLTTEADDKATGLLTSKRERLESIKVLRAYQKKEDETVKQRLAQAEEHANQVMKLETEKEDLVQRKNKHKILCRETLNEYTQLSENLMAFFTKNDQERTSKKNQIQNNAYYLATDQVRQAVKELQHSSQISTLELQIKSLEQQHSFNEKKRANAIDELASLEESASEHKEILFRLRQEIEAGEEKIGALTREYEKQRLNGEEDSLQERLTGIRMSLGEKKDMLSQFQTFGSKGGADKSAVCEYLRARLPEGVFGRVHELIAVSNPSYMQAIACALGRQSESIIVRTYNDAMRCVNLLKEKRYGIEEFLPLDTVKFKKIDNKLRQHPELYLPAVDYIGLENDSFMPAILSIVGDTVIVDGDLDKARQIAFHDPTLKNYHLKIVTKDGQKIAKNTNITLNSKRSYDSGNNLVSGQRVQLMKDISRLQEEERTLLYQLDQVTKSNRSIREAQNKLGCDIENERATIQKKRVQAIEHENIQNADLGNIEEIKNTTQKLDQERQQIEKDISMSKTAIQKQQQKQTKDKKLIQLIKDSAIYEQLQKDLESLKLQKENATRSAEQKISQLMTRLSLTVNDNFEWTKSQSPEIAKKGKGEFGVLSKKLEDILTYSTKGYKIQIQEKQQELDNLKARQSKSEALKPASDVARQLVIGEQALSEVEERLAQLKEETKQLTKKRQELDRAQYHGISSISAVINRLVEMIEESDSLFGISSQPVGSPAKKSRLQVLPQIQELRDCLNSGGTSKPGFINYAPALFAAGIPSIFPVLEREGILLPRALPYHPVQDTGMAVENEPRSQDGEPQSQENETQRQENETQSQENETQSQEGETEWARSILRAVKQEKLVERISEWSDTLRRMNVNLQASVMFEGAKARYVECQDQFDLLKNEKHSLDSTLHKIRDKRRHLFITCFEKVNGLLDEIYTRLTSRNMYTGDANVTDVCVKDVCGMASIELEDEVSSEPFTKGIIFHAIPPGKRYTDIESLSGGEKTMAALALVFAMQGYRQSPFLILDEVDAALDLENVNSLRDYLVHSPFQVFMVTLKEEVYSFAEAIIGVFKNPRTKDSNILTVDMSKYPTVTDLPLSVQTQTAT